MLRAIHAMQPQGVDVILHPEVVSAHELHVGASYSRLGWTVTKHYHVEVREDRVAIVLASLQIQQG